MGSVNFEFKTWVEFMFLWSASPNIVVFSIMLGICISQRVDVKLFLQAR